MSQTRIELNSPGITEFLKSAEIQDAVNEVAGNVLQRCGNGYETDQKMMPTRFIASVYTVTPAAVKDNLKNNTLFRAVGK